MRNKDTTNFRIYWVWPLLTGLLLGIMPMTWLTFTVIFLMYIFRAPTCFWVWVGKTVGTPITKKKGDENNVKNKLF